MAKTIVKRNRSKKVLLENSVCKIDDFQTRPYISVIEVEMLFGISKNTMWKKVL